jgi:hypothetical protein
MTRYRVALDAQGLSDEELSNLASFLSSQVDSMDPESITYGAYVAASIPGNRQEVLGTLPARLLLAYRKYLVGWFEYALMRRARVGRSGRVMKRIETGLAEFVMQIPDALASNTTIQVSDFVPRNDYLLPERINVVGDKILRTVRSEAAQAGVLVGGDVPRAPTGGGGSIPLELVRDDRSGVWYIPAGAPTYEYRNKLRSLGFRWNPDDKVWSVNRLTDQVNAAFGMVPKPSAAPSSLTEWFQEWLRQNIGRFTKVFTDYARNQQSSYAFVFSVDGSGKVKVTFKRDVNTPAKAVAEIRYRYTGRQGRGPWLEVLDRFIDLVSARSADQVLRLIDRINNLQHSNGLFMEHFPTDVQSWYMPFLNAKYHTPTADELAKQIPDRDLRGLLIEVARHGRRPADWMYSPSPAYHLMRKELEEVSGTNWRKEGYPFAPGKSQVNRFAPEVQARLDVLEALDTQRENILSTEVTTPVQEERIIEQARDWSVDAHQALNDLNAAVERHRQRRIEDPAYAADWEAVNFPADFIKRFPYSAPGSGSEFGEFVSRYAALGFAFR